LKNLLVSLDSFQLNLVHLFSYELLRALDNFGVLASLISVILGDQKQFELG